MKYICELILLFAVMASGCTSKKSVEDLDKDLPEVTILTALAEDLFEPLVFTGTLVPSDQTFVYAPLSGVVKKIFVSDGDLVKAGDPILQITPDSLGQTFQDHIIRAPRPGTVLSLNVKKSRHIDKDHELVSVADVTAYKTSFLVTQDEVPTLRPEMSLDIVLAPGKPHEVKTSGVVTKIAGAPNQKTKLTEVSVSIKCLPDTGCSSFVPGVTTRIVVKKNIHKGLKLPQKFLRRQNDHLLVLKPDDTCWMVPVKLGHFYGDMVEITEGLQDGSRVVGFFSKLPTDGQKVRITQ